MYNAKVAALYTAITFFISHYYHRLIYKELFLLMSFAYEKNTVALHHSL